MKKRKPSRISSMTATQRNQFDKTYAELLKDIEPMLKELRDSERITAADLAVTINAR